MEPVRSPIADEAVLHAAAQVIAAHGWHEFTLERVAEAAGLNRATLYRRGVTKELLIDALRVGATQAYQAALWPALTGSGTGGDRLTQALRAICAVSEQHRDLLAGLDSAPDPVFHLDGPESGAREVYVAPLERLLTDGNQDGTLRVDDTAETAVLLLNIVPRTYLHMRSGHSWSPEQAVESLLRLLLPGLGRAADVATPPPLQER